MTDQERAKAEELIGRLEIAVGQIFPRDSGNSALMGSLMCNGIGGNGSCDIHYDEALAVSSAQVSDYKRVSWVEDVR